MVVLPVPGLAVAIGAYNRLRNRSDAPEMPTTWCEDGIVWTGAADFSRKIVKITRKERAYATNPSIQVWEIPFTRFDSIMI